MNRSSLSPHGSGRAKSGFWLLLLCLTIILGFLFKDVFFKSEVTLFSNDGPLGVIKSEALRMPGAFAGMWMDLHWLGMNGSAASVGITYLLVWLLSPVGYAKFYEPISLFLLGVCAWTFFRTLKLPKGMAIVAALAAALNMNFFSNTCWGLGSRALTLAMVFLALAALNTRRLGNRWLNAVLAGLAVGMAVIEGADNGVIFSFFVAAFVVFQSLVENETVAKKITSGTRVVIVALAAGVIACQVLIPLMGIAKGTTGITAPQTAPKRSPADQWAFATQWSLPPMETLRVIIPGLYGYRMETPDGSEYWGRVGEAPQAPEIGRRSSGAGEYAGVLVVLVGIWALAQSLRRSGDGTPVFTDRERKYIWFWAAMLLIAVVFSWGRHAPFYRLIYPLPFFSSIRNPMKFMHAGHLAVMILFGYGLLGLSRRYLEAASNAVKKPSSVFEKRWALGSLAAFGLSLVILGIYASSRGSLVRHLMGIGFTDPTRAGMIASFSIGEVGKFVLFLLISVVSVLLIQFGVFTGAKSKWAVLLLGAVVVVDLARADVPWITFEDYQDQYASNPVIDILKDKPWEHRVVVFPRMMRNQQLEQLQYFYQVLWLQKHFQYYNVQSLDMSQEPRPPADKEAYLEALSPRVVKRATPPDKLAKLVDAGVTNDSRYKDERVPKLLQSLSQINPHDFDEQSIKSRDEKNAWVQNKLVEISNGQGWDKLPEDTRNYFEAVAFTKLADGLQSAEERQLLPRYWQLTNTRYVLALAGGFADALNEQLDPGHKRFKQDVAFKFTQTPGSQNIGAETNPTGPLALIEFTGALPRAKVYSQWQVSTKEEATLAKLGDLGFDPAQTVLVSDEIPAPAPANTNATPGSVEIASYSPRQIELNVKAAAPSVVLFNDKFDPDWKVWVDGKPAKLLRCNYLMRGVQVPVGDSKVRFHFEPSLTAMKITVVASVIGLLLSGLLFVVRPPEPEGQEAAEPVAAPRRSEEPQPAVAGPQKAKTKARRP